MKTSWKNKVLGLSIIAIVLVSCEKDNTVIDTTTRNDYVGLSWGYYVYPAKSDPNDPFSFGFASYIIPITATFKYFSAKKYIKPPLIAPPNLDSESKPETPAIIIPKSAPA